MSKQLRRWGVLIVIALIIIAIDQVTKAWVLSNMRLGQTIEPIPALVPYFQFTRSSNTGAAFGMLSEFGKIFQFLPLVIVAFMLYWYPRIPEDARVMRFATAVVVGGALGNVLDRLQHGLVVDFIHYRIPNVISNVSNIADHAIVIGVLILAFASWQLDRQQQQEASAQDDESAIIEGGTNDSLTADAEESVQS